MRRLLTTLTATTALAAFAFAPATTPAHDRAAPQAQARGVGLGGGGAGADDDGVDLGDDGVLDAADELPAGCVDTADGTHPFRVLVEGEAADGAIAFPAGTPSGLVVFAHGYGHSSHSWTGHMQMVADELGLVAVGMDYRGTLELPEPGEVGGTRGWQVKEGAADSNAAAAAILTACPDLAPVVLFGVSMGGNTSGLALAAQPTRPGAASPLYDWWINVEGAANVVETYLEARSLASSGNAFANNAVEDIEREVGGPIEDDPQGYRDLAVVSNVDAIVASGVGGVFHVHGVEDGLVPYNQARELWTALHEASGGTLPQEFWTALRRDPEGDDPGQAQTNLTDYALNPVDPGYESPLVGHGSESSAENDVMAFSFERLASIVRDGEGIVGCTEGLYDATSRRAVGDDCR